MGASSLRSSVRNRVAHRHSSGLPELLGPGFHVLYVQLSTFTSIQSISCMGLCGETAAGVSEDVPFTSPPTRQPQQPTRITLRLRDARRSRRRTKLSLQIRDRSSYSVSRTVLCAFI